MADAPTPSSSSRPTTAPMAGCYPDGGTSPFRGEKGSACEGGWRVPGIMWLAWPHPSGCDLRRNDVPHRLLVDTSSDGNARLHFAGSRWRRPEEAIQRQVSRIVNMLDGIRQQRLHPEGTSHQSARDVVDLHSTARIVNAVRTDLAEIPKAAVGKHPAGSSCGRSKDSWLGP